MTRLRRRAPLVITLATVIALRALVPIGYMLSLPGGGPVDWALHLCPIQNPSLDVSLFHRTNAPGDAHHAHSRPNEPGARDEPHVAISAQCNVWLDSAAPALAASPTATELPEPAADQPADTSPLFAGRPDRHSSRARAPPRSV